MPVVEEIVIAIIIEAVFCAIGLFWSWKKLAAWGWQQHKKAMLVSAQWDTEHKIMSRTLGKIRQVLDSEEAIDPSLRELWVRHLELIIDILDFESKED